MGPGTQTPSPGTTPPTTPPTTPTAETPPAGPGTETGQEQPGDDTTPPEQPPAKPSTEQPQQPAEQPPQPADPNPINDARKYNGTDARSQDVLNNIVINKPDVPGTFTEYWTEGTSANGDPQVTHHGTWETPPGPPSTAESLLGGGGAPTVQTGNSSGSWFSNILNNFGQILKNGFLGGTWSTDAGMNEWGNGFKAAESSGETAQYLRDHPIGNSLKDIVGLLSTGGTITAEKIVAQQLQVKFLEIAAENLGKTAEKLAWSKMSHIDARGRFKDIATHDEIVAEVGNAVRNNATQFGEGSNAIRSFLNEHEITINLFFKNGELQNVNVIPGLTNRCVEKLLDIRK